MGILAILVASIAAGNLAALFLGGYSLGAIGNSIAGLTGSFFLSTYMSTLFGMSYYASHMSAGIVGALVILLVFEMTESAVAKKIRLY